MTLTILSPQARFAAQFGGTLDADTDSYAGDSGEGDLGITPAAN